MDEREAREDTAKAVRRSAPHLDGQTWQGNLTLMLEAILTAPLPQSEDEPPASG